ncbi:iron complex outermembrane receptor protein [Novosphingobium sp. 1748]|uniref:TonB-dependent receptor n=1 Tax=Novosphingobium sp. 1748 TaxID=2817760 RepID=UPI002854DBD4|nr:TonB-dependent receptor [Novosphingobium sp. 1748]MDR6708633.1 iron complex outermembrane receptor protein [Novosphingobium sp. 1748]
MKGIILKSGCAVLALAVPALANAQATADKPKTEAATVNDIIVTAQFRGQRLQDTPIAITALSGDALLSRSYNTITDLSNTSPNVVLKPTGSAFGPGAAIYIRGIGQADTSFAYEPGVGLYVDDVYRGAVFGAQLDLLDLDRVEILRGPQGTLAGKNSIGGAVKLYTKKPNGTNGGFIEATTGSRDRVDVRAGADITLVPDKLFARISGVTRHQNGYLTRYDFGCRNPAYASAVPATAGSTGNCVIGHEGGTNYTAARLALRWIATDNLEVNVSASRLVDDSEPSATKLIAMAVSPILTPGVANQSIFLTPAREYSNYSTYQTPAFTDAAGSHPTTVWQPNTRLRTWDTAMTIDWKLGDIAIKSVTAYQNISGRYGTDFDGSPFGINTGTITNGHRQFTQELRISSSSFNKMLDWTLGAYYYKATSTIVGGDIIAPGAPFSSVFYSDDRIPARSLSGFAHGVVHVTDKLDLTGGIRYTDDKKDYYFERQNPFNTSQTSYTAQSLIDGAVGRFSGSRLDYRANASYKFTPGIMAYAQFSTGYRGGGINPRPFVVQQVVPFNPETLSAYEIGLKSSLFDRAVQLNLSGFINDYSNIIFMNTAPTVVGGVLITPQNSTPTNAGNAQLKGIEAELHATPVNGLSIDASLSCLDFKLKSIGASGATIANITLASQAPFITKWKGSVGVQYEAMLGSSGSITPRIDFAYQSSFYTNVDNNPLSNVPGYTMLNGRITWNSPEHNWSLSLAVTNMANNFYYLNKVRLPIGITTGTLGAPREWSLSLRRKF